MGYWHVSDLKLRLEFRQELHQDLHFEKGTLNYFPSSFMYEYVLAEELVVKMADIYGFAHGTIGIKSISA